MPFRSFAARSNTSRSSKALRLLTRIAWHKARMVDKASTLKEQLVLMIFPAMRNVYANNPALVKCLFCRECPGQWERP